MPEDELQIQNPTLGSLKVTGQTVLIILALAAAVASGFGVYLLFEGRAEAAQRESTIANAITKMADAQEEVTRALRENACVVAYRSNNANPKDTLDFCKQITR